MTKTISILSDIARNQIAAGEVVESPAAVIKECVENAVDAGASAITVEIKDGGHHFLEVSDNGKGMGSEDVELSIYRFATSKIKTLDDLNTLKSMGFRGEALAAISSVSKFSILSSTGGVATLLETSGGKDIKVSNASRARGTTVCVQSLFYNTPARKKFQKARGPSTTEAVKCITKLSLCHKDIAFTLIVDGKLVFSVEGDGKSRLREVLGKDFFAPSVPVEYEGEGLKIKGVIASPEKTRSNRLGQYLIVNHRNVFSLLVSNGVLAGFGTSLSKGEFPLFFLEMTFDPGLIDVNVHPQKREIRFQEEERVFAAVREAVSSALTGRSLPAIPAVAAYNFKTNAFKEFNFVEKRDEIELEAVSRPLFKATQPFFEERGHLQIQLLWDELCLLKVTAPHPKFSRVEEKETVLIDLSLLEKRNNKTGYQFTAQELLAPLEIFLTKGEIGFCEQYINSFRDIGITYQVKDVSIVLCAIPSFVKTCEKEIFHYALSLFERGEHVMDVKEKILFRVLRKKKYTENEALYLIENTSGENFGTTITKKDMKGLCKEYTS